MIAEFFAAGKPLQLHGGVITDGVLLLSAALPGFDGGQWGERQREEVELCTGG